MSGLFYKKKIKMEKVDIVNKWKCHVRLQLLSGA